MCASPLIQLRAENSVVEFISHEHLISVDSQMTTCQHLPTIKIRGARHLFFLLIVLVIF